MTNILLLILLAALFTTGYLMISRKRHIPHPNLDLQDTPDIQHSLSQLAGLTGGALHHGTQVIVHQDGELIEAMMNSIREARHTVHFETFVWTRGKLERHFVALLCEKARQGVVIRVLVDSLGAIKKSDEQFARMRNCGIQLAEYNPINRFSFRRFNNRTHRKLLIVDGEIGFTFGHGIKDTWCGEGQDKDHWRDTGVYLRGSVVCSLQVIFVQDWIEASPNLPLEESCFLQGDPDAGTVTAHVVTSSTLGGQSSVALLYMLAIAYARKEIIIQNPYFAPERHVVELLVKAVERGVCVHLMIPGDHTDSRFLRRAGQCLYTQLLQAGVRLYEFEPTLLHQKVVIVDKVWSHIGSTNFDDRSLVLNAEIGVGLLDKSTAAELRNAFEKDLRRSRELDLQQWKRRPFYQHFADWCAYQLHGQL